MIQSATNQHDDGARRSFHQTLDDKAPTREECKEEFDSSAFSPIVAKNPFDGLAKEEDATLTTVVPAVNPFDNAVMNPFNDEPQDIQAINPFDVYAVDNVETDDTFDGILGIKPVDSLESDKKDEEKYTFVAVNPFDVFSSDNDKSKSNGGAPTAGSESTTKSSDKDKNLARQDSQKQVLNLPIQLFYTSPQDWSDSDDDESLLDNDTDYGDFYSLTNDNNIESSSLSSSRESSSSW